MTAKNLLVSHTVAQCFFFRTLVQSMHVYLLMYKPSNGEGNGTPLQCFCLENPMDGGAWWAAVYGASQSRTRLKRLSSSSSKPSKPSLSSLWTIDDFGVFSSYAPGLKTRLMEIISIFLKTVYKQNVI